MDLFFEREKTRNGEWPSTLVIDIFPNEVREQCWQAWENSFDRFHQSRYEKLNSYSYEIVRLLRERLGKPYLTQEKKQTYNGTIGVHVDNYKAELREFFLKGCGGGGTSEDIKYAFTVLEIICNGAHPQIIDKINLYLQRGGIGYSFFNGALIPFTDENLLESSIKPAISLLNQKQFINTSNYLNNAFKYYKEGDFQTAIDNCGKAFECLLKTIFDEREIDYGNNDTLTPLIEKAINSNLFPNISDDKKAAIGNLLKILPEVRNKGGGHGENNKPHDPKLVRFAIHHTTSNMLYIAEKHLDSHPS